MNIRAAAAPDAAGIAEVHVRSWQAAYRGMMPQEYLDELDPAQRAHRWRQTLAGLDWARAGVLVAEDGAEIRGFASFGPSRDGDENPDQVGEISAIYLAHGSWDMGYGRALMSAALQHLTRIGYTQATLWVLDANARARRFYEKAGFHPDGAQKADDRDELQLREVRYRRALTP